MKDVFAHGRIGCKGKRFKKTVLSMKYKGYSISDVLDLTIQ